MMRSLPGKAIIAIGTALITARQVAAQECQSQGTGNCQLYFTGDHFYPHDGRDDIMRWQHVTIYNWRCDVIGGRDNPAAGQAIYSQLPYTVVIDLLGDSFWDISQVAFRYGSYSFKGDFLCSETYGRYDEGRHDDVHCIHAFPC